MKNRRNYYRILQVQPDAPAEVIRASYRALMKDAGEHPDLGGSNERASLLNEAWATLRDAALRAAYDATLFDQYTRHADRSKQAAKIPVVSPFCPACKTPLADDASRGEHCPSCDALLPPTNSQRIARQYRRSVERIASNERVLVCSDASGAYREARAIDISPKGMRLHCAEKLASGALVKISGPRYEALASVTNVCAVVAQGRRVYAVGLAFITVDFETSRGSFLSTLG